MRVAPPPSTGSTEMVQVVLSLCNGEGIVRQQIERPSSTATISQVRDHRLRPTRLRPRKRAPGRAAVAPSTNSTVVHSWLHSPVRVGSPTTAHTALGGASTTTSTVAERGIVPTSGRRDREHRREQV